MALKVYRTPIGFHDAFVAAPSQKAALAAWGSDANLFARGVAEVVTDPALTAEPLARPGEVIKRLRGTADEQLAAAPSPAKKPVKAAPTSAKAPAGPRPDRRAVEAAEKVLAKAEERQRLAEQALTAKEAALAEQRRKLRAAWIKTRDALEAKRDAAEEGHAAALKRWRDGG